MLKFKKRLECDWKSLWRAAKCCHENCLKTLLKVGVDVNKECKSKIKEALITSIENGHESIVKLLIKAVRNGSRMFLYNVQIYSKYQ